MNAGIRWPRPSTGQGGSGARGGCITHTHAQQIIARNVTASNAGSPDASNGPWCDQASKGQTATARFALVSGPLCVLPVRTRTYPVCVYDSKRTAGHEDQSETATTALAARWMSARRTQPATPTTPHPASSVGLLLGCRSSLLAPRANLCWTFAMRPGIPNAHRVARVRDKPGIDTPRSPRPFSDASPNARLRF